MLKPNCRLNSLHTRHDYENLETQFLASYAMRSGESAGRCYAENEHDYRTCYQRDRDRIIHSVAFRRLEYKTQVFLYNAGDHYRTRLTHTLEVAQIARTLGRILGVNEDLCEANALAHDLGHPPFGHEGERVLNELLSDHGGFEHNAQALRIVDCLEKHYPTHPGLNLTAETRRGILKNKPPYTGMGENLADFLPIEAQLVDLADEISYTSHDLDDGIESGLLRLEDLRQLPLWNEAWEKVEQLFPAIDEKRRRYQIIIQLINEMVMDVARETHRRLCDAHFARIDHAGDYSESMSIKVKEAKRFLMDHLYRHRLVLRTNSRCRRIITRLFEHYSANPKQLPRSFLKRVETEGLPRSVADYVSGMTDRYADEDYKQIFGY
ncbi:MAG: deoxyguanosinetriphosphate triphosphohydrolase [Candidatus Omnitrophota bacterium]|jgi:dGTPase|nr:MAG: deoxyguanosinetriphosphate triphosphohydrolase [Candidatus Omnitrophota bacterium]